MRRDNEKEPARTDLRLRRASLGRDEPAPYQIETRSSGAR
jgi:hypothetical protein